MNESIIAAIDTQIAKLQQARTLLTGTPATPASTEARRPGRPKGSKNGVKSAQK